MVSGTYQRLEREGTFSAIDYVQNGIGQLQRYRSQDTLPSDFVRGASEISRSLEFIAHHCNINRADSKQLPPLNLQLLYQSKALLDDPEATYDPCVALAQTLALNYYFDEMKGLLSKATQIFRDTHPVIDDPTPNQIREVTNARRKHDDLCNSVRQSYFTAAKDAPYESTKRLLDSSRKKYQRALDGVFSDLCGKGESGEEGVYNLAREFARNGMPREMYQALSAVKSNTPEYAQKRRETIDALHAVEQEKQSSKAKERYQSLCLSLSNARKGFEPRILDHTSPAVATYIKGVYQHEGLESRWNRLKQEANFAVTDANLQSLEQKIGELGTLAQTLGKQFSAQDWYQKCFDAGERTIRGPSCLPHKAITILSERDMLGEKLGIAPHDLAAQKLELVTGYQKHRLQRARTYAQEGRLPEMRRDVADVTAVTKRVISVDLDEEVVCSITKLYLREGLPKHVARLREEITSSSQSLNGLERALIDYNILKQEFGSVGEFEEFESEALEKLKREARDRDTRNREAMRNTFGFGEIEFK